MHDTDTRVGSGTGEVVNPGPWAASAMVKKDIASGVPALFFAPDKFLNLLI